MRLSRRALLCMIRRMPVGGHSDAAHRAEADAARGSLAFRAVLFVDDQPLVASTFCRVARRRWVDAIEVHTASTCDDAIEIAATHAIDLAIVDIRLGDEDGSATVAALVSAIPRPIVVATSAQSTREEVGRMFAAGACGFVEKTLDERMLGAIEQLADRPVSVTATAASLTGRVPLHRAEASLRHAMVSEALARAGGNRRIAARMLGISRQVLQHMMRTSDDWPSRV